MVAAVEQMAYRGEVPWHGLGISIDQSWSVEDIIEKAGIDWEVEKKKLRFNIGVAGIQDYRDSGFYGVVRKTDNTCFGTCTAHYHPIQNREAIQFIIDLCNAHHATVETMGALMGGSMVWALARLNKDITIGDSDKLQSYLLIAVPHTPGRAVVFKYTNVRVVCWNTISMALAHASPLEYRVHHIKDYKNQLAEAEVVFRRSLELNEKFEEIGNKLHNHVMFEKTIANILQPVFDPKGDWLEKFARQEDIISRIANDDIKVSKPMFGVVNSYLNAPGAEVSTAWGVLNGVTHYLDHEVKARTDDSRLASSWFGKGNTSRNRVYSELTKLLEAA